MLFKTKKCTQCGSQYDVVEETCPACHARDENFEALKIPKNQVWLPIYKQITLFLLGFVVINIISTLCADVIFKNVFPEDSPTLVLVVNYIRYGLVLIMMGVLLIGSYPKFKSSFVKWLPYVVGVTAGLLIVGFTITYNLVIGLFHTSVPNENQAMANALVKSYPLLAFILLSFFGPTVEELTYRVGLFTFLSRIHKAIAYAVTIVFFAFIHFNFLAKGAAIIDEWIALPVYVVSGGVLCLLYDQFGLSCSLTAHITNNIISTLPVLFGLLVNQQ